MGEWRYGSTILDLGTRWRWVVSFTPRPLYLPGERAPGTHWIGGWVGPKVGVDTVEKRKISHCRESNPGRPARRYTDWAIPTSHETLENNWIMPILALSYIIENITGRGMQMDFGVTDWLSCLLKCQSHWPVDHNGITSAPSCNRKVFHLAIVSFRDICPLCVFCRFCVKLVNILYFIIIRVMSRLKVQDTFGSICASCFNVEGILCLFVSF
jgi:hypothetical protein